MAARINYQAGTSSVVPIRVDGGRIILLDQRKIPQETVDFDASGLEEMCFAIKHMVVRGAPAIGAAAALGLALEANRLAQSGVDRAEFFVRLEKAKEALQSTRPTAVNLSWDTELVFDLANSARNSKQELSELASKLIVAGRAILEGYEESSKKIGENGAQLVGQKASVLTHCNAGALACLGWGTALGVIRAAYRQGAKLTVFVDETRPRQQGSRLTAWELLEDGITPTLITDSMAGHLMAHGKVDLVVVGADRIALNGDTANKIGTYSLAVLANAHGVPFYVAAPLSTIDPDIQSGKQIPIEEREHEEVTVINDKEICPPGVEVFNPSFDVTPARLITAIVTEAGVLRSPYEDSIKAALDSRKVSLQGSKG